jgi:hypothetical protein
MPAGYERKLRERLRSSVVARERKGSSLRRPLLGELVYNYGEIVSRQKPAKNT